MILISCKSDKKVQMSGGGYRNQLKLNIFYYNHNKDSIDLYINTIKNHFSACYDIELPITNVIYSPIDTSNFKFALKSLNLDSFIISYNLPGYNPYINIFFGYTSCSFNYKNLIFIEYNPIFSSISHEIGHYLTLDHYDDAYEIKVMHKEKKLGRYQLSYSEINCINSFLGNGQLIDANQTDNCTLTYDRYIPIQGNKLKIYNLNIDSLEKYNNSLLYIDHNIFIPDSTLINKYFDKNKLTFNLEYYQSSLKILNDESKYYLKTIKDDLNINKFLYLDKFTINQLLIDNINYFYPKNKKSYINQIKKYDQVYLGFEFQFN